jgi:pimeloyl-ACP methyl ester carboxylesterase
MKRILVSLVVLIGGVVGLMALFPEKVAELSRNSERSKSGLTYKTVVVADETWHYLEGGEKDAEVVLLLHGFGTSKDVWTQFLRPLANDYRVIAPDLPGFGQSARHPDWNYTLPPQRDRLNDFVTALGLEEFHMVGHSMGGHLAALYTHKYAAQVLSIALFDSAGVAPLVESDMQRALANGDNPLLARSPEEFDEMLAIIFYTKPFIPWPIKGVYVRYTLDHADFNQSVFVSYVNDLDSRLEPILGEINKPTLIIWGEFDRVIDVTSVDVMRPLLPQAEVVIMEDTGHAPQREHPGATAAHYLEFVDKY